MVAAAEVKTDADRRRYLRSALEYLDGLPLLLADGRPDQVALELQRIRATVAAVERSLAPVLAVVAEPVPVGPEGPPGAICDD